MKNNCLLLICLFFSILSFSQEKRTFKSYSFSEFFQLIKDEPSDILTLKDANIVLDTLTDQEYMMKRIDMVTYKSLRKDSLHIQKTIVLENVFVQNARGKYSPSLNKIVFHKPVRLTNSNMRFDNNHFLSTVRVSYSNNYEEVFKSNFQNNIYSNLHFKNSVFEQDPRIVATNASKESVRLSLWIQSCTLKGTQKQDGFLWRLDGFSFASIDNNIFLKTGNSNISFGENNKADIYANNFGARKLVLSLPDKGIESFRFSDNQLNEKLLLNIPEDIQNLQMDWKQLSSGVMDHQSYMRYTFNNTKIKNTKKLNSAVSSKKNFTRYLDSVRIVNNDYYKSEIRLLGTLKSVYKRQHDMESANGCYIALKDLETQRLEFLYRQNTSFDTYFEWKVNQFLKVFSNYGTKPAKAITFSVYVILIFALIYLFFPNHWDSHGKRRIMDRYRFFTKYMNQEAGIHEVYLEDQKEELLESEDFKNYMLKAEKTIPKFFMATAMPLYKWSVSGTKFSSSILKRLDIMKGTWSDLPQHKRIWKSILLVGAFLIAIIYDIAIKMLNALMLSINTFTTLGFGEIPIKGLPRYLAIIQGFIGWFMLTIFSVSLISQLLN